MNSDKLEILCSKKTVWAAVLVLCLVLRIGAALYKGDTEITDNDARMYIQIADNLTAGKGFALGKNVFELRPTAYVAPGYPVFLAMVYNVAGDGLLDISLAQSVVDTITCLLVMSMMFTFGGGRRFPAVAAGLLYAVYPTFILSTCTPMTETLATFVFTAGMLLTVRAFDRPPWYAVLAGAVVGVAILIRSPLTLFPLVMSVLFFVRRRERNAWLARAAGYVLAVCVVLVPWGVRNHVVMGSFLIAPTSGSQALWGGTGVADGYSLGTWTYPVDSVERNLYNHPRIPKLSEKTYQKITALQAKAGRMSEVDRDKYLRKEAIKEIRSNPGRYAFLAVKKVFRLWLNLWNDWPASSASVAVGILNSVFLLLGLLGYRRSNLSMEFRVSALATCVYVTVVSALTFAVVRYSYPVMPLVLILAIGYVDWFIRGRALEQASRPQANA